MDFLTSDTFENPFIFPELNQAKNNLATKID